MYGEYWNAPKGKGRDSNRGQTPPPDPLEAASPEIKPEVVAPTSQQVAWAEPLEATRGETPSPGPTTPDSEAAADMIAPVDFTQFVQWLADQQEQLEKTLWNEQRQAQE